MELNLAGRRLVAHRVNQRNSVPSAIVYRSLLSACIKRKSLVLAKHVHAEMAKHRVESTSTPGERVVNTLVKSGGIDDALQVFYRLPHRTTFSFTAVIRGLTKARRAQEALALYRHMREQGLEPNKYTFASLFKACGDTCNLKEGRQIHEDALYYQCVTDVFVGTCLLDMYAKCGSCMDAQNVFDGLSKRDVVSWTAMLVAYAQQGQAEKALQLFGEMLTEGVSPNDRTFASALQACAVLADKEAGDVVDGKLTKVKALKQGELIHCEASTRGYESDLFVGSSLITMYSKCGRIAEAERVFDGLSGRDVVSWNAMLAAYTQLGQPEMALQSYEQMLEEGVKPDARTFVSALQACGMLAETEEGNAVDGESRRLNSLHMGKAIHNNAQNKGCDVDHFVGNTLVTMYGKCGSLMDAENVFNSLSRRDVVSWNAMLASFAQQGHGQKALMLYGQMLVAGVSPDVRTFVSSFQACGLLAEGEADLAVDGQLTKIASLGKAKAIHAEAWRRGYASNLYVGNSLLNMYGKCGSSIDAQHVFDALCQQDVVAWTAMLAAYAQQSEAEKVLQLYQQMLECGVDPDYRALVISLQGCGILADQQLNLSSTDGQVAGAKCLELGKLLHAECWRRGYSLDVFVCGALISMYGKCRSSLDAKYVFDQVLHSSVAIWNAMLTAYIQLGQAEKTLLLYVEMVEEDVSPDVRTFVCLLQACGILAEEEDDCVLDGGLVKIRSLHIGKAIHAESWSRGYNENVFIGSAVVSMYGKCASVSDAQSMFEGLSQRDVVAWNVMLAAYAHLGQGQDALQLYRRMEEEGFTPNEITLVSILQACSNVGNLDACSEIHDNLLSMGISMTPLLANSLIHAYGKCASMFDAQNVFDALPEPNVVSWSALIAGYARQGNWETSLQMYEKMQLAGVKPNGVTFLSVLSACSHAGLLNEGIEYFESMTRDHGVTPEMEHYVSMMDLLGRSGQFQRLQDLLSEMTLQPDLSIWLCLLGACRKHGKLALGRQLFDRIVSSYPKHPAAYSIMTNMYAHAGLWDHVQQVNELRQGAGAWRKPAQTWTSHEQELHAFEVEDDTHPQKEQLYLLSTTVSVGLKQVEMDNEISKSVQKISKDLCFLPL